MSSESANSKVWFSDVLCLFKRIIQLIVYVKIKNPEALRSQNKIECQADCTDRS